MTVQKGLFGDEFAPAKDAPQKKAKGPQENQGVLFLKDGLPGQLNMVGEMPGSPDTTERVVPLDAKRAVDAGEYAVFIESYHRPRGLLDACCKWLGQQGGTIHQVLPRIKWEFSHRSQSENVWYLTLDGVRIGSAYGAKKFLPEIDAVLGLGYLDDVWEEWRKA